MRLVSFASPLGPRLGASAGDHVIDLNAAYAGYLTSQAVPDAAARAAAEVPADAAAFLRGGAQALERARAAVRYAMEVPSLVTHPRSALRLLSPVPNPPKVICLGLNYMDHAAEASMKPPDYPVLFSKYASTLIGHGEPIRIPRVSDKVDYEAELAVVIGRPGRYVSEADALDYVAGYTILNDVSVRDYQMRTSQWTTGKMFHRSTPVGPELVTADEVGDPESLEIELTVNGRVLQKGSTRDMIFAVAKTVAYISEICELEPGDIIATGTPAGVGFTRQPPIFLKPGDTVTVRIDGLGALSNPVASEN